MRPWKSSPSHVRNRPRECSHCETAAKDKGVTKLITKWHARLNPNLPRVGVWDNTLMLTPREPFARVAQALGKTGKPVDLVCGLTPNGVEETELQWRIGQFPQVRLTPARLECNTEQELPRSFDCLHRRATSSRTGRNTAPRPWSTEQKPQQKPENEFGACGLRASKDVVWFTPHDWEDRLPYVNHATGWTAGDLASLR